MPLQAPKRAKRLIIRRARAKAALHKPNGLPLPPDLKGFNLRAGLSVVEHSHALESSACRALLLEIIRRAAFDWVLYRSSSKLCNRQLAENAHHWLFVEDSESITWTLRKKNGKELTGFITICELLEIDPERVRSKVRTMTERDIMCAGRPAERRRNKINSEDAMHSDDLPVFDVDVDNLPVHDPLYSSYSTDS